MVQPLKARIDTVRSNLMSWTESRKQGLGERADSLKRRGEALRERAEARVDASRGRVVQAEAQVIEVAVSALARASEALGDRAVVLERGERALRDALVAVRATHPSTLPVADYDTLNVKQALLAFAELDLVGLRVVRAYEAAHKDRVTLLRDLDKRLAQLSTH